MVETKEIGSARISDQHLVAQTSHHSVKMASNESIRSSKRKGKSIRKIRIRNEQEEALSGTRNQELDQNPKTLDLDQYKLISKE